MRNSAATAEVGHFGRRADTGGRQPVVRAVPLSVKRDGAALTRVWLAW